MRQEHLDPDELERVATGIWMFDTDYLVTYANAPLCSMLAIERDALIGRHVCDFVDRPSVPTLERHFFAHTIGLKDQCLPVTLVRGDGGRVHTRFNISPIHGPGGGQTGSCALVMESAPWTPCTALIDQQRDEMRRTIDRLQRVIAHVCREIRDPLNVILGCAQLAAAPSAAPSSDAPPSHAALCRDASAYLTRILDNASLWAQLQQGETRLAPTALDSAGLLQDLLEDVEGIAVRKNLRIVNTVAGPDVFADLTGVSVAVHHLLDNAVRFADRSGTIVVSSQQLDEGVGLTVRDDGPGIAPEQLDNIRRALPAHPSPDTEGVIGGGLGLLLCRKLADMMGGALRVASAPGQGTAATLVLPAARRRSLALVHGSTLVN